MNSGTNRAAIRLATAAAATFLVTLTSVAAGAVTAEHTFNVIVEAHCHDKATVCDYWTEFDFRAWAQQGVYNLNNHWRQTGISFQLKSVTCSYNDDYDDVKDDSLDTGEEADLVLLNNLRAKAKADPANVYWFVLDDLGMCFSGIPGAHLGGTPNPKMPDEYYGVFCNGVDGNTMAHEIGHHFCLAHPFTWAEPASVAAGVNHDGDGLSDTPDDPGIVEAVDTAASATARLYADVVFPVGSWCGSDPESCATTINDNRDWCGWTQFPTDPGSMMGNYCVPDCRRKSGGTVQSTTYAPDQNLTMSYYFGDCGGPFVYNFKTYEGFSPMEVTRMQECYSLGSERGQLTDVCGTDKDTDWDGICDKQDPCPNDRASIWDADADSDDVPDVCDACLGVANSGIDTDGDGIDNACDPNDDNDACNDDVDEHPLEAMMQVGTLLMPGCSPASKAIRASESKDSDNDGIPDCRDPDNDDDGIMDADDPCPNIDGEACQIPGQGCEVTVPWASCMGGGCQMDLLARLESLTNPGDPWEEFPARLVDENIFLLAAVGRTAGEIRGAITGLNFNMVEGAEKIHMSLVDKATGNQVADVGTFRIADAAVVGGTLGNSLSIAYKGEATALAASPRPTRAIDNLIKLEVGLTWAVGIPAGEDSMPDADSDGVPDAADNCTAVANPSQADIDQDHIGDACDPDFDNDGKVTDSDVAVITDCVGIDLRKVPAFPEPGWNTGSTENVALAHAAAMRCKAADLDGNGIIDATDQATAAGLLGQAPGPSGMVKAVDIVEPLPDQIPEKAADSVTVQDTVQPGDSVIGQDIGGTDTHTGGGGDGCATGGRTGWSPLAMLIVGLTFLGGILAGRRRNRS
jgi:hypothetical protein